MDSAQCYGGPFDGQVHHLNDELGLGWPGRILFPIPTTSVYEACRDRPVTSQRLKRAVYEVKDGKLIYLYTESLK